jgi:O-acetyl-ADP-ribose deacetylase (regulator of RNase III)
MRQRLEARQVNIVTLAVEAISCGVYGYPLDQAVRIAVHECAGFVAASTLPEKIVFACFDGAAFNVYEDELRCISSAAP